MTDAPDTPRVHVVGTGLIGTSLGLALTRAGGVVTLEDISSTNAALARDLGAGETPGAASDVLSPDLVVVATPPDVTAACVAESLERWPEAVVTDVASVKVAILDSLRSRGADLSRFCGSHPMAGRERNGAVSGRHDLFHGRAWVLTPTDETSEVAVALVRSVASSVGAAVVTLDPADHDAAVASVSHVPQARRQPRRGAARAPRRLVGGAGRAGSARRHAHRRERPAPLDPDPLGQRARRA